MKHTTTTTKYAPSFSEDEHLIYRSARRWGYNAQSAMQRVRQHQMDNIIGKPSDYRGWIESERKQHKGNPVWSRDASLYGFEEWGPFRVYAPGRSVYSARDTCAVCDDLYISEDDRIEVDATIFRHKDQYVSVLTLTVYQMHNGITDRQAVYVSQRPIRIPVVWGYRIRNDLVVAVRDAFSVREIEAAAEKHHQNEQDYNEAWHVGNMFRYAVDQLHDALFDRTKPYSERRDMRIDALERIKQMRHDSYIGCEYADAFVEGADMSAGEMDGMTPAQVVRKLGF